MVPIHPMNFKWIGASVLLLLNANQIQDGCHGGHFGIIATPNCNRVLYFMDPIYPVNFKSISVSVLLLLSENQMQDGCHGGHIGKVTTPIFNSVLLIHSPNPPLHRMPNPVTWDSTQRSSSRPYEFQMDPCKCSGA